MYCYKCGAKIPEDAKFCSDCGASLKSSDAGNLDLPRSLQLEVIKLTKDDSLSPEEKTGWADGVFIGKEGGKFYVDLPEEYQYSNDIRLRGTNSFVIKTKQFIFTLVGEEISKFLQFPQDIADFKNSIKIYLDKISTSFKTVGIEPQEKSFKQYVVETENSWWCRVTFSYTMNSKIFWKGSGYNPFGKALVKILAGDDLKKAGYGKGQSYEEYKVMDFFYPKANSKYPFFVLAYTFDEINGGDRIGLLKTINGISDSLGYYDEKEN